MLHGELVGTNRPQARNLFTKGCSPSQASFERILFPVRKPSGISEDNDSARVQLGGLIQESPGLTPGG